MKAFVDLTSAEIAAYAHQENGDGTHPGHAGIFVSLTLIEALALRLSELEARLANPGADKP